MGPASGQSGGTSKSRSAGFVTMTPLDRCLERGYRARSSVPPRAAPQRTSAIEAVTNVAFKPFQHRFDGSRLKARVLLMPTLCAFETALRTTLWAKRNEG